MQASGLQEAQSRLPNSHLANRVSVRGRIAAFVVTPEQLAAGVTGLHEKEEYDAADITPISPTSCQPS